MTSDNWLTILTLLIDLIKTSIPFIAIFYTLVYFRAEIKALIEKGQLKISGPGFSLETTQQAKEISENEKKELDSLNKALERTNKPLEKKVQEIQTTTMGDSETLFLGYHFEKTYRIIFPTQMVILLSANTDKGELDEALAHSFFAKTVWSTSFGMSYEQFIGFLFRTGLLKRTKEKLSITPLGRLFLEYLAKNNIPTKLPPTDQVSA